MGRVFVPHLPQKIKRDPRTQRPILDENGRKQYITYSTYKAAAFGDIIDPPLFPLGGEGYHTAPIIARVRQRLKDYCDDDCLLGMGDPAAIAAAAAIASDANRGRFNILRWDKEKGIYVKVPFNVREFEVRTA